MLGRGAEGVLLLAGVAVVKARGAGGEGWSCSLDCITFLQISSTDFTRGIVSNGGPRVVCKHLG